MGKLIYEVAGQEIKTYKQAIEAADASTPANLETLVGINNMLNYEVTTLEDFRWFVLMNHVRSIDAAVNKTTEHDYLRRIQENILYAAHKILGKTKQLTKA